MTTEKKTRAKNFTYEDGMLDLIIHFYNQGVQIVIIVEILNDLGFKSAYKKNVNPTGIRQIIKDAGILVARRIGVKHKIKNLIDAKPIEPILTRLTSKGDYVAFCTTSRKPIMRAEKQKDIDLFIKAKKQAI